MPAQLWAFPSFVTISPLANNIEISERNSERGFIFYNNSKFGKAPLKQTLMQKAVKQLHQDPSSKEEAFEWDDFFLHFNLCKFACYRINVNKV
jgi:hypothetical protein